jgi:hypothetical protein
MIASSLPQAGSRNSKCSFMLLSWVMLLASGCATPQAGTGGSGAAGMTTPARIPAHEVEEAVEAEANLVRSQVKAVASLARGQQARQVFNFWMERGALTITGYSAQGRGGATGSSWTEDGLDGALRPALTEYTQDFTGEARLVLRHDGSAWEMDWNAGKPRSRPTEAKTMPVRREATPAATVQTVAIAIKELLREVRVPEGGAMVMEVEVYLEDDRLERWEQQSLRTLRLGSGNELLEPTPATLAELSWVLLPFTQGVGARTVRLTVHLEHRAHEARAHGWVVEASVERPPPPRESNAAFVAEYRALHEFILRRWREETREGAEWVARQGAEEVALWYVGGVFFKGGGYLARWADSTVRRALGRGGEAAAGWLRTTLTRLPGEEKKAFEQLWRKVQLEGEQALSRGERRSLSELMEGIERLVHAPMDSQQKKDVRRAAREYYKQLRPEFAQALDEAGAVLPIHHRRPMEYAHCFPDEDINAAHNLVMVRRNVHQQINRAWDSFRKLRPEPTAQEVDDAARIIDEQFVDWYHQAHEPPGVTKTLEDALSSAIRGLEQAFPG